MGNIDFRAMLVALAVCLAIAVVIDYFSSFHWLPTFFFVLAAVLVNGLIASFEGDRLSHVEGETDEAKRESRKVFVVLCALIVTAVVLGFYTIPSIGG